MRVSSCLCWNPFIKSQIASSDYDGIVSLWDANTGESSHRLIEHTKRIWSIDFSPSSASVIASGSDDSTGSQPHVTRPLSDLQAAKQLNSYICGTLQSNFGAPINDKQQLRSTARPMSVASSSTPTRRICWHSDRPITEYNCSTFATPMHRWLFSKVIAKQYHTSTLSMRMNLFRRM
jgi:WD40 repeat protein